MVGVIINPGSGPVQNYGRPLAKHAVANMRAFRRDCGLPLAKFWRHGRIENGRYPFRMKHGSKTVEIDMPGLPLKSVRYLGGPDQNAWHFPRLYIAGSSWLWTFAVPSAMEELGLGKEAEQWRDLRDA